jgi:hypothetical protein
MPIRYEVYARLEPVRPIENLQRGFLAEVYDPAWFLGRQWQMGEHQGENASSPVTVSYEASHSPVTVLEGNTSMDTKKTPPEAIVESEPGDWWTPGRRIRIGIEAGKSLLPSDSNDRGLLLSDLPAPYEHLNGKSYDGKKLYEQKTRRGLDDRFFTEVPTPVATEQWQYSEFSYEARFIAAGQTLKLERHSGGHVDWYSVDAEGSRSLPSPGAARTTVHPTRMRYPGAPSPWWWQIEDANVDIGGYPPDRSHFATMLLIDLIATHSDDWFTFPVDATTGEILTLKDVKIQDSFGDESPLLPPANWSLFKIKGIDNSSLLVWPTAVTPLAGPKLEEVVLGIDEDANFLWAVERRLNGRDVPAPLRNGNNTPSPPSVPVAASERKRYDYLASTDTFPHWHPYQLQDRAGRRSFVQSRLADLTKGSAGFMPAPEAKVLNDPEAQSDQPAHIVEPASVPSQGLIIERRYMLVRDSDANPVLWIQRQTLPLLTPPGLQVRFDVLEEKLPGSN